MEQNTASQPPAQGEDKTVAIVAYLSLIGFIIALILHGQKKTALGSYHLRQTLGILICGFALGIANFILIWIPIIGWLAIAGGFVCIIIMWLMGIIAAANGEMKPTLILGPKFQEWFKNTFN
ncbi:MAG TPA: hypothetical protein PK760_04550 [Flavobacteriales bacterium]|jgi:uncharacterized membrane protein|nr:hypothetical protein [Flavobacteriales bacterium]